MRAILITGCLILASNVFAARPDEETEGDWRKWNAVGQAQLTMLFFDIYQSQLLTPTGSYAVGQDITPHPLALSITYQRDISRSQLLEATQEQWQKLGYTDNTTQAWVGQLEAIFPDISKGHNLTYVTDGSQGEFFYTSDLASMKSIGTVEEELMNDAFLAIWLSPKTDYPQLRQNLIGEQ
ncbi:chalcone isomerase family protein [Vibrio ouci]|uniref:Chalcone isomerase domain-containing protein n=1 Tax=Vibrio ouci TaxID=2499078 RepID=A0A4Y8WKG9_9VIBR|nr:chalcone isomerase family protein [Vibrio ouci]TFH92801.1 hypothetical protein ELS82_04490 [Vibrio ouci]